MMALLRYYYPLKLPRKLRLEVSPLIEPGMRVPYLRYPSHATPLSFWLWRRAGTAGSQCFGQFGPGVPKVWANLNAN
jgi:hypothetical protein